MCDIFCANQMIGSVQSFLGSDSYGEETKQGDNNNECLWSFFRTAGFRATCFFFLFFYFFSSLFFLDFHACFCNLFDDNLILKLWL